jgi:hypothetical protein
VKELIDRPDLLEVAPRQMGNYLSSLSEIDGAHMSRFFELLEKAPTDRTDAVQLHLLRAAGKRQWGWAEGTLFGNIAFDPRRRAPVRAQAMEALANTPSWNSESALGLALTHGRPIIQRAATLSFRSHIEKHSNRTAVQEVESCAFEFGPTAQWVLSHSC